ncbi:hypothetical protein PHLGIDRAFT_19233 [Phlebiopsis gigantea 11061_1 CR5-6]|uniref:Uncharacterized protein n=1 Tax=Phlebiopsis gigantea (strain 11061_1 CR5-6) TaxID=745531 RepID=A0A0C3RYK3_PHLG1|nr:hypothetical protein PHLGIDRAFT_19233 [Phlebiopsis gigantea 11061_1 CR5-6]
MHSILRTLLLLASAAALAVGLPILEDVGIAEPVATKVAPPAARDTSVPSVWCAGGSRAHVEIAEAAHEHA